MVEVLNLIECVCDCGFGVIIISYNMEDVCVVVDCIVVLCFGCNNGIFMLDVFN